MNKQARLTYLFLCWFLIPFIAINLIVPAAIDLYRGQGIKDSFDQRALPSTFIYCFAEAVVGTLITMRLRFRNMATSMIVGFVLGGGLVVLTALILLHFQRGMESGASVVGGSVAILFPTCIAGAVAGLVAARQNLRSAAPVE